MPLAIGLPERRRKNRVRIEVHSLDDAHRLVEVIGARDPANSPVVRAWHTAKNSTWLLLLVVAFLLFYLVSNIKEVFALVCRKSVLGDG